MSTLTDQIKSKCATIAQNLKKIYDKGFADGKASVKHITFTIENEWEMLNFCAFDNMTWREFVASDMNDGYFSIANDKIYHWGEWLGFYADDKIVDKGIYYPLTDILYGDNEFLVANGLNFGKCVEDYNKDNYIVDDGKYIKTLDGRMLVCGEFINDVWPVEATSYPDTSFLSYYLTPDSDLILFFNDSNVRVTKRGNTWRDHANSIYSQYSYTIDGDRVIDAWGCIIQLDGKNVNPSDVIVEGENYTFGYDE